MLQYIMHFLEELFFTCQTHIVGLMSDHVQVMGGHATPLVDVTVRETERFYPLLLPPYLLQGRTGR